jgi:hypothetical protein
VSERDMPSMLPPRHELTAIADELVADIRHYYGVALDEKLARALRADIVARVLHVRKEAARAWLGSALTRGGGDD